MNRVDFYETKVIGANDKAILIHNGSIYSAVVIVEYLDFFETYNVGKFVKITGMKRYYQHDENYVIVIESDRSAKLIEKELRYIDFQYKIIDNDYHALGKLIRGEQLIEKEYYEEPYY